MDKVPEFEFKPVESLDEAIERFGLEYVMQFVNAHIDRRWERMLPRIFITNECPTDAERVSAGWSKCEKCGMWYWTPIKHAHEGVCKGA